MKKRTARPAPKNYVRIVAVPAESYPGDHSHEFIDRVEHKPTRVPHTLGRYCSRCGSSPLLLINGTDGHGNPTLATCRGPRT
jgi:hypothetical protein